MSPVTDLEWLGLAFDYGPRLALVALGGYLFWRAFKTPSQSVKISSPLPVQEIVRVFADFSLADLPNGYPLNGELDYVSFSRKYRSVGKMTGEARTQVKWKVEEGSPPSKGIRCRLTMNAPDSVAFLNFSFVVEFRQAIAGPDRYDIKCGDAVEKAAIRHSVSRLDPSWPYDIWLYADGEYFVDIVGVESPKCRSLTSADVLDVELILSEHRPHMLTPNLPLEVLWPHLRKRQATEIAAEKQPAFETGGAPLLVQANGSTRHTDGVRTQIHLAASEILPNWETLYEITEAGLIQLRILADTKTKRRDNFLLILLAHAVLFDQEKTPARAVGEEMRHLFDKIQKNDDPDKPTLLNLISLISTNEYSQDARDTGMVERVGLSSVISYRLTYPGMNYALDLARDLIRRA